MSRREKGNWSLITAGVLACVRVDACVPPSTCGGGGTRCVDSCHKTGILGVEGCFGGVWGGSCVPRCHSVCQNKELSQHIGVSVDSDMVLRVKIAT